MSFELVLTFDEFEKKMNIMLTDDDGSSTETIKKIIQKLPLTTYMNKWGEELYTDDIKIKIDNEKTNLKQEVYKYDVAFWPEGSAICLFFGPTPISTGEKIIPYSPVKVIGKITTSKEDYEAILRNDKRTRITIGKK